MALTTANLPTLYEHYTAGGITTGLSTNQSYFTLNEKNITLYSGAMHYFRVPRPYWRDRLKKMRAAGLNTVETYVPWNLHETEPGTFDFGNGTSDFTEFLDVQHFLQLAKEEDMFAIVRPGPYICSEWEFGGLPSWLLKDKDIVVRTSQPNFMQHVTRYFNVLLPLLALFQFTKGGPVIAFQVENEYGVTNQPGVFTPDKQYLRELRQLMLNNGIGELLFTSDSPWSGTVGTLPEYFLQTANFGSDPTEVFNKLQELQPGKPTMAMEYWVGWMDHWTEDHHTTSSESVEQNLEAILRYPGSFNAYMFHGGTNWGFMNGASIDNGQTDNSGFQPSTTSYDYDAPLTEAGDYTDKYTRIKNLIERYNTVPVATPELPAQTPRRAFPTLTERTMITIDEAMSQVPMIFESNDVISMEQLPIGGSGQRHGYITYRKTQLDIPANGVLKIGGHVCDTVMVVLNGVLISPGLHHASDLNGFGYWRMKDSEITLSEVDVKNATVELIVENWGRNNVGWISQFNQYKGLWQDGVYLNNEQIFGWEIIPLEFRKSWNLGLTGWHQSSEVQNTPTIYKYDFEVDTPQDTYLDMSKWSKGIVIVNGFVLGRYAWIGPQQTLYYPAPFQKTGKNEILIFEHFEPADRLVFVTDPIFGTPRKLKKISN